MIEASKHEYSKIHLWLRNHHGQATRCENLVCNGSSTEYEWSKKRDKPYVKDINNFWQLCKSCHRYYDNTGKLGRKSAILYPTTVVHCSTDNLSKLKALCAAKPYVSQRAMIDRLIDEAHARLIRREQKRYNPQLLV